MPRRPLVQLMLPALVALSSAGCVSDGPPPAEPLRPLPAQPADIRPDRILLSAGQVPEDADRNGYYDTVVATVYLFNEHFVAPLAVPGRFTFRLVALDGTPIARWELSSEQAAESLRRFLPGPGYLFRLNIADAAGSDRLKITDAQLFATFHPVNGPPIEPRAGTTVVVGARE